MFRFYAERLWDVDEAQNIVASLVKWSQECVDTTAELCKWFIASVLAFFCALFFASFESTEVVALKLAAGAYFTFAVAIVLFGNYLRTVHCKVTFDGDGRILMPRGRLLGWLLGPRVLGDHREIATIQIQEAESFKPEPQKARDYEIWFYFEDGWSIPIADSLRKQQAHHVAVLLEQALNDIRKAVSQPSQHEGIAWAEMAFD